MTASERVQAIQQILGVQVDGIPLGETRSAFDALCAAALDEINSDGHKVKASSFADPADVRAFKRCKATGKTDQQCFRVGDNAVGVWGDATDAPVPMCALPVEDWKPFGKAARGKKVLVKANGKKVVCELRDTMPARAHIKNGAGVDLNPTACAALGLKPPIMVPAVWQWA